MFLKNEILFKVKTQKVCV